MSRRRLRYQEHFEQTAAREALERHWFPRVEPTPQLAPLVTGEQAALEPYHRWLAYRQAFAPKLVRLFLAQAEGLPADPAASPLLDPFAGSGTVPIECARHGVAALGVEAVAALCFVAQAASAPWDGHCPAVSGDETWQQIANRLDTPVLRAALMLAHARRHTADGRLRKSAEPIAVWFRRMIELIRCDRAEPLTTPVSMVTDDARELAEIEPGSIGGILTSPPYLSRHDYTQINRPLEQVYAHWYADEDGHRRQLAAHPRARPTGVKATLPPAAEESCAALRDTGHDKLANVVQAHFADLAASLHAAARVLRRDGPLWMVIGGARLHQVYIPSDLIAAELAQRSGFEICQIREARRLITSGRRLGTLQDVAPRESLLIMRRHRPPT